MTLAPDDIFHGLRAGESEKAVLGACLWNGDALDTAFEVVRPEDFFSHANQLVARTLVGMREAGGQVDSATLHDALYQAGQVEAVNGPGYLATLQDAGWTDNPDFIRHHAFRVAEAAAKRQLVVLAEEIKSGNASREVQETAGLVQHRLEQIQNRVVPSGPATIKTLLKQLSETLTDRYERAETVTGTPTGLPALDGMTGGLQSSDLVLLAARPSVGKTALALTIARTVLEAGRRVVFFSLEMSAGQIVERLLSSVAGVPLSKIRNGRVMEYEVEKITRAQAEMSRYHLTVDDRSNLTVVDARSTARRACADGPLGLVVLDYVQLAQGTSDENRNLEVASISRGLKALAKELSVPVLALSQLSRRPEQRTDKRPTLSDLRDSGALEQDADLVMFLHREDITDHDNRTAELILAKHRNGPTGVVDLEFTGPLVRFAEPAPAPMIPMEVI